MALAPYFEVNGNRYEIRRSRYLMVEFEKIRESSNISDDDPKNLIKLREKVQDLDLLKNRKDELYKEFLAHPTKEAKEMHALIAAEYDALLDEVAPALGKDGVMTRVSKAGMDNAEKLVIVALQRGEDGKVIRSKEEAENIWCSWVDEVGQKVAQEWLNALIEHITGEDEREDDNSFLAQAKARAEQQAENRKAGLAKIKK